MRRFEHFANAVFAAYASTEPTFVGASNRFAHADAVNRIVAYLIGGPVGAPTQGAQGATLASLEPNAINAGSYSRDDIVATRSPVCAFEIWANDEATAEDRLHKLIVAFDTAAGQSELGYSDMREDWPASRGDVSAAGGMVTLFVTVNLAVLLSDKLVDTDDTDAPPIGSGTPEGVIESVAVTAYVNDADPLNVVLEEEET